MKTSHFRVSFIMLVLLVIWSFIILTIYSIPGFVHAINDANGFKYEIMARYVDECFWQKGIIGYISFYLFHTLTYAFIIIFLFATMFKPEIIKVVGRVIIVQNIILLSLELWEEFLINELKHTIVIDIKLYLFIVIFATIVLIIMSLKKKTFYLTLSIFTVWRCIHSFCLFAEYFASIYNIQVILYCFNEMLLLILYWIVLISINRNIKLTISTSV